MPSNVFRSEDLSAFAAELYKTEYPLPEIEEMGLAVDPLSELGAEAIKWELYEGRGQAQFASLSETKVPLIQEATSRFELPQQYQILGYGWTMGEMLAYTKKGQMPSIDASRAEAVRKGIADVQNVLGLFGTGVANGLNVPGAKAGHVGLYSHPQAQIVAQPNAGTWATKTAELIYADMLRLVNSVISNTRSLQRPTMLVIPSIQMDVADEKIFANAGGETAISRFQRVRPEIRLMRSYSLSTAGAGNTPRMVAFDSAKVSRILAAPFEVLPAQTAGYSVMFPCYGMSGGVKTAYPKSIGYMDGL